MSEFKRKVAGNDGIFTWDVGVTVLNIAQFKSSFYLSTEHISVFLVELEN